MKGIVGFYSANSVGDDIEIYDPNSSEDGAAMAVLYGLRQQVLKLC